MLPVGSLVKFSWWSTYKAPSLSTNELGHVSWHEINPGDRGVIVGYMSEESVIVLFSSIDSLLRVNRLMIEAV